MYSLKKKVSFSKIQNAFQNNSICILFQYNHVLSQDWRILKTQITENTILPLGKHNKKNFICNNDLLLSSNKYKQNNQATELTESPLLAQRAFVSGILVIKNKVLKQYLQNRFTLVKAKGHTLQSNNKHNIQCLDIHHRQSGIQVDRALHSLSKGPIVLCTMNSLCTLKKNIHFLLEKPNFIFLACFFENYLLDESCFKRLLNLDNKIYNVLILLLQNGLQSLNFVKTATNFPLLVNSLTKVKQTQLINCVKFKSIKTFYNKTGRVIT